MGPSITAVGRLRRALVGDQARIAVFYDTEIARITNSVVYPLANYVCTPDCYQAKVHGNHITYPGYHELAYLHPNRFTPDAEVVRRDGVDPTARYAIVRFVSYKASHDIGTAGLTSEQEVHFVRALAAHGTVYVSSEAELPAELEPHRLRIPVSDIHHVVAHARLLAGESATMASEAAVLGVPAIYVSPLGRGYTADEEARYGLVRNFVGQHSHDDWTSVAVKLFSDDNESRRAVEARATAAREDGRDRLDQRVLRAGVCATLRVTMQPAATGRESVVRNADHFARVGRTNARRRASSTGDRVPAHRPTASQFDGFLPSCRAPLSF